MIKKIAIGVAAASFALSAFAVDQVQVAKRYELKDGSTVYVFKDGKMGMEDQYGRAVTMKEGHPMEARDGRKIMMKGNEIWRVDFVLHQQHRGG